MTTSKKNRLKRAALSWLCVATMTTGANLTGAFPGIIPSVTASASVNVSLNTLIGGFLSSGTTDGEWKYADDQEIYVRYGKDAIHNYSKIIEIVIKDDAYITLSGDNFYNDSYYDVKIIVAEDKYVNIYCNSVFIKNDEGEYDTGNAVPVNYSSNDDGKVCNYVVPFKVESNGYLELSGELVVDTYSVYSSNYQYTVPLCDTSAPGSNVNDSYFEIVTYTDEQGDKIDENYFLFFSTAGDFHYEHTKPVTVDTGDGQKNLTDMFGCMSVDGAPFDNLNINGSKTVVCNTDHELNDNGNCAACGGNYCINLSLLNDYFNGTVAFPTGVTVTRPFPGCYSVTINNDGKYLLTGSNFYNDCYLDVQIEVAENVEAEIVCKDAFIKNDEGAADFVCAQIINPWVPFITNNGSKLTLHGKLGIDTYSAYSEDYQEVSEWFSNYGGTINTTDFNTVTYKDSAGRTVDQNFYLDASETNNYQVDKADVKFATPDAPDGNKKKLVDKFGCFDNTESTIEVTDDVTVKCYTDHSYGTPEFAWAADYSTCTATFTCERGDDNQVRSCTVTHNEVTDPTCTQDGKKPHKAEVTFGGNDFDDTVYETIPSTGRHSWSDDYESNEDGHWHKCENCDAASTVEPHVPGDPATVHNAQTCKLCGYEIAPKLSRVEAPVIDPDGGEFSSSKTVKIICSTDGAKIYYTTNGDIPNENSTEYISTNPLTITATTTVKAIAIKDGVKSSVTTATFTKESSAPGGSSGGSGGSSSYRHNDPEADPLPNIKGMPLMAWTEIADRIGKMVSGSEVEIYLNGCTGAPIDVIKVIADKKLKVKFVIRSQVVSVVDVYDALVSSRVYKSAFDYDTAYIRYAELLEILSEEYAAQSKNPEHDMDHIILISKAAYLYDIGRMSIMSGTSILKQKNSRGWLIVRCFTLLKSSGLLFMSFNVVLYQWRTKFYLYSKTTSLADIRKTAQP